MGNRGVSVSEARAPRRSARRGAMVGAALWLGAAWLACGGASDEGLESPLPPSSPAGAPDAGGAPDTGGAPEVAADAGACRGAPCAECPQRATDSSGYSGPTTAWGRNPETGTCCPYADLVFLPELFPFFESPEACENSCRCAELIGASGVPAEELGNWVEERISLECYCSEKSCPASLEAVVEQRCSAGFTLFRSEGCGRQMLELVNALGVEATWVFEQGSGALVGVSDASDVPGLPCRAYGTSAGAALDCPQATRCRLCGDLERNFGEPTSPCE